MNELLSQRERERVIARIRNQTFKSNRRNVTAWCLQWLAGLFSLLWFGLCLIQGNLGWNFDLFMVLGWLVVALVSHLQWERYRNNRFSGTGSREVSSHIHPV